MTVLTGADRVVADPSLVQGRRWGLATNCTGVTAGLRRTSVALTTAGAPLRAILGPEHGTRGTVQAGSSEANEVDSETGLPVYDTYLRTGVALDDMLERAGIDVLLVDLQDIGVRFYTYAWTMVDCVRSAGRIGLPVVVLDRPNPLRGMDVEGAVLDPAFASFVGRSPIAQRHGLTIGELALVVKDADAVVSGRPGADLSVVEMTGWDRTMWWADTGLHWVPPSPNIPTPETALIYAGTGLVEGTNLSEGRGTTRPFELIGAPWVDRRFALALNRLGLPGVLFRETWFCPTFDKYAGQVVAGVQVHVTDRAAFEAVRTAVCLVDVAARLYPGQFAWRLSDQGDDAPAGNGGSGALGKSTPFIDRLWGSDTLRRAVDAGDDPLGLVPPLSRVPSGTLLY